ncbi:MAG: GPR endopeptidase [Ruminococcaceae bacterium]|nr:GPR endopeptidase [Oscillospiraceae bacterium]
MAAKRTDLALEAKELWQQSVGETTQLSGVKATEQQRMGYTVTTVEILDDEGERELGKPQGRYVTIDLGTAKRRSPDSFERAVNVLAGELKQLLRLDKKDSVLVVGLGNSAITPDAIGPKTLENTMITRHLTERLPQYFGSMRRVSAVAPGVLGTTGLESAEVVKGVVLRSQPDRIIVVDALAAASAKRLCSTVQLSDTGITPGSGVGNSRAAFNRNTLGVPVIAIGVPTVVDARTLETDVAEKLGMQLPDGENEPLIVTPKDIDAGVKELSSLVGYGINLALHEQFELEDVTVFLS